MKSLSVKFVAFILLLAAHGALSHSFSQVKARGNSQIDLGSITVSYRAEIIGDPDFIESEGTAISDDGLKLAGMSTTASVPLMRGFYLSNGSITRLAYEPLSPKTATTTCAVSSINNSTQVSGYCYEQNSSMPALSFLNGIIWRNGQYDQFGSQQISYVPKLNNSGVAIGLVYLPKINGSTFVTRTIQDVTPTAVPTEYLDQAFDINDSNLIVGHRRVTPSPFRRGAIYSTDMTTPTLLPELPGMTFSELRAVNNSGKAVGFAENTGVVGPLILPQPLFWTIDGGVSMIPLPSGMTSLIPTDINNSGLVIGNDVNQSNAGLSDGTTSLVLFPLISNQGDMLRFAANGLSDNNSIIGTGIFPGNVKKAVLLIPEFSATIGGRVLRNGFGVGKAKITLSGGNLSQPIQTMTSPFGYYQIPGLEVGQTYTVTVAAKGLSFSSPSQTVVLDQNVSNIDFTAN